jgi:1-acyl-sn-glycerol-3-phosphate acyltransferase
MRQLTPILRVVMLIAWLLVLLPFQILALLLRSGLAKQIPMVFHRGVARVLGLQFDVRGQIADTGPILFVSNHSSWLDIVVLSALAPVSFVAKNEIAGWPGVSILAKLQGTVFVARKRAKTRDSLAAITGRLADGANLVLFPEGTRGDGNRILPFKSALFSAAENKDAPDAAPMVQPVSIAYTHLDGFPLGRRSRPRLTWYGKMRLGRHLWGMLGNGPARIAVDFHQPVRLAELKSRKGLAAYCRQVIADSHRGAISGRPQPLPSRTMIQRQPAPPGIVIRAQVT